MNREKARGDRAVWSRIGGIDIRYKIEVKKAEICPYSSYYTTTASYNNKYESIA
jgi:hypothetical protein